MGLDPCSTCVEHCGLPQWRRDREYSGFVALQLATTLALFILACYGTAEAFPAGHSIFESMSDFGLIITALAVGTLATSLARCDLKNRKRQIVMLTVSALTAVVLGMLSANGILTMKTAGAAVIGLMGVSAIVDLKLASWLKKRKDERGKGKN